MSNSSLKWSALIYGRTYEVDFRLIAMPEYFNVNVQARTWAENYILATTQIPEKLSGNPRWSLFTDDKYCVIATTCMVGELFPNGTSHETKDITTDFRGRPLYAFIGYVAERDESRQFPTLPAYSDLNLEQFQLLYQKYVEQCWDVKPYQPESRQPILTSEKDVKFSFPTTEKDVKFSFPTTDDAKLHLNIDQKRIRVWSEEYKSDVWNTVIQEIEISDQPISVCLSLSTPREAENSPFLNATVLKLDTSRDGLDLERHIDKPHQQTKETRNPPKILPEEVPKHSKSTQYKSQSKNNIPQRSNSTFPREKGVPSGDDRQRDYEYTELIVRRIVTYAFLEKYGHYSSEAIQKVPTAKFKYGLESLWSSLISKSLNPAKEFVESEFKQLDYDESNFNQDINELADLTDIDSKEIRNFLMKATIDISLDDLTDIVDDMLNLVSTSTSKIGIKEQQQYISRKLEGFELKAIDTKDNKTLNNNENQSKSMGEDNQKQTPEWF
ncbi:hypothetical protein [Aphanizomenon flos-aquae]|uniref:Uncharacterized protein n=1 Tax=Aphanizomenon flos-aquae FACHB-1040 TaxID=2692887 RepID=A0ABR8BYK1_APHFL|nr:hypothetical protein [Aphanizomenon flos-aquae]MBD2278886.1 hypothetical protein [Aphanizomenon flos-aquae FACHB-1040]